MLGVKKIPGFLVWEFVLYTFYGRPYTITRIRNNTDNRSFILYYGCLVGLMKRGISFLLATFRWILLFFAPSSPSMRFPPIGGPQSQSGKSARTVTYQNRIPLIILV